MATLAVVLVASATAAAASRPTVLTGSAQDVGSSTAVLHGTVNPGGAGTSYYFQYGVTRAYGGQSAIASAGAGTTPVAAALGISGLAPLTLYHYRIVAVNAAGVSMGSDRTLLTKKVPLSLSVVATPNPVTFGSPLVVQGTLSGTGNANRVVTLEANAFPFAGFQPYGNPQLTNAAGAFSFPVVGLAQATEFRVIASAVPNVLSAIVGENVAVRVSSHVGRARRHGYVRFYGTVSPEVNGAQVAILRTVHGRGVLVGGTSLRPHGPGSSAFSRAVRVHRGTYRVLVRVTNNAQVSAYSQPLVIH
jgi:hypothetical protein